MGNFCPGKSMYGGACVYIWFDTVLYMLALEIWYTAKQHKIA